MILNWQDTAVQSALIQACGTIIAAMLVAFAGIQIANRRKLQEKQLLMQQDIAFLMAVEDEHCKLHVQTGGESFKIRIRGIVKDRGLLWSGKFTPGRTKDTNTLMQGIRAVCDGLQ